MKVLGPKEKYLLRGSHKTSVGAFAQSDGSKGLDSSLNAAGVGNCFPLRFPFWRELAPRLRFNSHCSRDARASDLSYSHKR